MKDKKFSRLLIRNTLMILMPPVAAIFMAVLVAFRMSDLREYNTYKLDSLSNMEYYINNYMLNVSFDTAGIKPAGYDYKVNGQKKGEYYYIYRDDQIWLFVMNFSGIEKLKNGETQLDFRITTDEQVTGQFMSDLAKSFGASENNLKGFINPIILNEPEYPYYKIKAMQAMLYGGTAMFATLFIYMILAVIFPSISTDASGLSRYGKRKEVIKLLNEEIRDKLLYHAEDAYVTDDFLITYLGNGIQVVKLDDVKYLSKHVEDKKGFFGNKKIYRLTASNVDKLYYEHEFLDEEVIDNVIYYVRREDLVDETEEIDRNPVKQEENKEIKHSPATKEESGESEHSPDYEEKK